MPIVSSHWSRCLVLLLTVVSAAVLPGCARKSPDQLLAEARDYADQADYLTASIQLRTLLKREPDNLEGVLMLAEVALKGNNPALAERNYRRADELGAEPAALGAGRLQSPRRSNARRAVPPDPARAHRLRRAGGG